MKLWHGTSSLYLEQIQRDGLDPACSCYEHICLSSDRSLAKHFGEEMARWEKADFVLFSIDLDSLNSEGLCHEMGWIGNSLKEDQGQNCLQQPAINMLKNHKVIGYNQVIPPGLLHLEERYNLLPTPS